MNLDGTIFDMRGQFDGKNMSSMGTNQIALGRTTRPNAEDALIGDACALFFEESGELLFTRTLNPIKVGDKYEGRRVRDVFYNIESANMTSDDIPWKTNFDVSQVKSVNFVEIIRPYSTAGWFEDFTNCQRFNISCLDTSLVSDMHAMFKRAGSEISGEDSLFTIVGTDVLTMNRVRDVSEMFYETGCSAEICDLGCMDTWYMPNVTKADMMFFKAGHDSQVFNLGNLASWSVPSLRSAESMFKMAGKNATSFYIGSLHTWKTSCLRNANGMFNMAGYSADTFNLGDISGWDTSSIETANEMFSSAGQNANIWAVGDLSRWNVSNLKSANSMFAKAGQNAEYTLDLTQWDLSKMQEMTNFSQSVSEKLLSPVFEPKAEEKGALDL